jgi:hypothetical protein
MADTGDDAGQGSGVPDGRRRREPPTIDVKAVEVPVEGAASTASSPEAAPRASAPPSGTRARTPWFPILTAGVLGAGLAVLAGGAAWIYFPPLDDHATDALGARVARLELQTQTAAEVAAATVPDMGKVPAAKIEELSERLAKLESAPPPPPDTGKNEAEIKELSERLGRLETASAATAPENGRTDVGKIAELAERISKLESAPPPAAPAPDPGKADAAETKELSGRLARLESSIATLPAAPDAAVAGRLAAVEAQMKPLAEHVADLDRQNGDNASAVKEARERSEAVAKAMDEVNRADADQDKRHQSAQAALATLNSRLDAVETLVKAIKDQVAEFATPKGDEPLRFAVVAAGLRFALERGEPFTAELGAARAVGIDPAILSGIAPFAATGVPNQQELFRELTGLVPEMLKVSAPGAEDGNYLDRLQAHAQRLVRIRPVGDKPGDDAATVIGRIDRDMARRDLAGVLAELGKLPPQAQAIAEPWRKKALARQAATTASTQLAAVSFGKLGAPAGATNR